MQAARQQEAAQPGMSSHCASAVSAKQAPGLRVPAGSRAGAASARPQLRESDGETRLLRQGRPGSSVSGRPAAMLQGLAGAADEEAPAGFGSLAHLRALPGVAAAAIDRIQALPC